MEAKLGVLDRIEQSFILFKNNFVDFFLPMFLYNLVAMVLIMTILIGVFFGNIGNIFSGGLDIFSEGFNIFTFLNNSFVIISIIIGMIFFIIYLILYIPVFLGLLKSIKQAINNENVTSKENVFYGFSIIKKSFKTYWYIFAYVALIPSLFFILGGLLFNFGYFNGIDILKQSGAFLMILSSILFIIFIIYRGTRTIFSMYSALDSDSFTKTNFLDSINITTDNWWRIVGNFLLISLIISLVTGFISGIINLFSSSGIDFESIKGINDLISISSNFSILSEIFSGFFESIIGTTGKVFLIVFTYVFFIRLRDESINGKTVISKKNKNLSEF